MSDYINFINGFWEKTSRATVPLNDAGFLLGDGLFETIRFQNKKLILPEKHLQRLSASLHIIHIDVKKTHDELLTLLNKTIKKNHLTSGL